MTLQSRIFKVALFVVAVVVVAAILAGFMARGGMRFFGRATGMMSPFGYSDELSYNAGGVVRKMGLVSSESFAADSYGGTMMRGIVTTPPQTANSAADRRVIRSADVSVVVKDVREGAKSVAEFAVANGGFVVSSNVYQTALAPRADVTVRVPAKSFDAAFEAFKKLGILESESVQGQDVTEEFVDMEARLKNLRATEAQLQKIMERSGTIPDVLAAQRELMYVREQIESIQARMKYLQESVVMSLFSVHLSSDAAALPVVNERDQWKPVAIIKEAARSLIQVGKGLVNVIIWFVIFVPLWILIVLVIWVLYVVGNRVYQKVIQKKRTPFNHG